LFDPGTEFDFLHLDVVLFLLRLPRGPGLFVLELAVVHHADDRWPGVRSDLHEVEGLLLRTLARVLQSNDADVFALFVDESDGADSDLLVDADSLVAYGRCLLARGSFRRSGNKKARKRYSGPGGRTGRHVSR